jgi:probable F420-dependent oxidoreductase
MNDLGRYGLWAPWRIWPEDAGAVAEAAREIQDLGFGAYWIGGSPRDDLGLAEAVLASTTTLVVGTSIVDIWTSNGERLAASHARIAEAFPGRFYLGVGSGHAPSAESLGQSYTRPLSRLREFLTGPLAAVPAQERMIAALGPKALETAAELTAGALPYLMPPAHTAEARRILGAGPLLVPEQKVFLGTDAGQARHAGRRALRPYLSLPNYTRQLARYGLDEADLADEGSDRFIDSAVVRGDDDQVRAGIDAHLTAGADHVAVQVLTEDGSPPTLPREQWRRLAEILALSRIE